MADEIAVKAIGGVPVIRCKIHYGDKYIEAHILFDLGQSIPLVIHEKSIGGLELAPQVAAGKQVDIEFASNVRWKGIPMQVKGVGLLESLTAKYAKELKEVPVVAIVGLSAIKSSVVELDFRKGKLRTLGMASEEASEQEFDYEGKSYGIVLKGTGPAGVPVKALMFTRGEDSILDKSLLQAARQEGEKPNFLEINKIKFGDSTPFRFRSLDGLVPDAINAVIGAGALRKYTVTIWPKRKKIAFLPQAAVPFPQAEQDYFLALADGKPEGVVKFISKNPRPRLLDEACLMLWQMRMKDSSSTTEMLRAALKIIGDNYDSKHCSEILSRIADGLEDAQRPDKEKLGMFALDLAMAQSKVALDHTAVHGVHVRLGKRAFGRGDLKQARRHLLSAAFGMPKNGECNFWLGEVYKKMGKPRRAWSRYFQAILDNRVPDLIRANCLVRLDELNRDPEFRGTFNMVVAEQYMAGRLEDAEFHAVSRYQLEKKKFPGHVKLVEFFTNANDPATGGMQLAFQALDEFFEGDVALISYHLNDPMHSETARNRLESYKAKRAPLAVFDGKPVLYRNVSQAEKLPANAAENAAAFRKACLGKEIVPPPKWILDTRMTQNGTKVSGAVTVVGKGQADKLRLHAIVCERSVMALEANGVFFHHFVARKALTPPDGLDLKSTLEQPFEFAIDAEKMREDLIRMLDSGKLGSGRSKPTFVDANKLMVVAFVQNAENHRVLAAKSFSLPQEDEVP